MSNPKSKNLPETLSMYLVILVTYCIDIFFFQSDRTVLADAFFSRCAGLIILFGFIWIKKSSVSLVGISAEKNKAPAALILGTVFSVIPIFIVIFGEFVYYTITDFTAINLQFETPNVNYIRNGDNLAVEIAIIIYFLTTLVSSVFKEFFFRGFLLKRLKKSLGFNQANILQAVLYMFMTMPLLLRNLVTHVYDNTTVSLGIYIVMFYIIHETLAAIKWGLMTRVTGATYMATVDHFLYVFISNSVFVTSRYAAWAFMAHTLMIQIISFLLVLLYYKVNMKKLLEKRTQEEMEIKRKEKQHIENRKYRERNNIVDEKIREINEISPEQYKDIVNETNDKHHHHHHSSSRRARQNEANSAINEELIDHLPTGDADKIADDFRQQIFNEINQTPHDHHHHHHHHRHHSENSSNGHKKHRGFLFGKTKNEAQNKASELSDSVNKAKEQKTIKENQTQHHHHNHEHHQNDNIENFEKHDVDYFLKTFNDAMETPVPTHSHHHHHSDHSAENKEKIDDLSENFDADKFLEDFQNRGNENSTAEHGSSHHHHHHHHSHHKNDDYVVSMNEVPTEKFYDEYQKTVKEKREHEKLSFIERMRNLGKIDDSEYNDLL